jgi:hypothetical protein
MRLKPAVLVGVASAIIAIGSSSALAQMSQADMQAMIAGWSASSQKAFMATMAKYGPPQEMTRTEAMWLNNGPWKYTMISATAIPHNFPVPHDDVIKQAVNYNVPPSMFSELANYDGSVIVERTKGEIAARCDQEGANMLALNLANDIITHRRSIANARAYYAHAINTFHQTGTMDPYMRQLRFTPPATSGDPDHPAGMSASGAPGPERGF